MPFFDAELPVTAPELAEIVGKRVGVIDVPHYPGQGIKYLLHMLVHCMRKHGANFWMTNEKACVKVLHRQIGILGEVREGLLYQPGIKIPVARRKFFGLGGTGRRLRPRNVIFCVRACNSC